MPITESDLRTALTKAFPAATIEAKDLAGDQDHWSVIVTDASFAGKSRIDQHRMVQAAVKDHTIHALAITTKLP